MTAYRSVIELGWLIESETGLLYLTVVNGALDWTPDHMEALRFARRVDAERFMAIVQGAGRVAEHSWSC